MPAARAISGLYSVHPGLGMVEKWKNELPAKTGRSVDEWIAFVKKSGPATEKERREWLKREHKMGTNSAWWIAERAEGVKPRWRCIAIMCSQTLRSRPIVAS